MAAKIDVGSGSLWNGDCLEMMADIPDGSVDMILCDLPYGTTQNKWDAVIPFEALWKHYWRVVKPNAAIVLTAQPPFDKTLGASQIKHFKYEWIWEKYQGTGHLNAKKQPMKCHENVLVFYAEQPAYNPQFGEGKPYKQASGRGSSNYGSQVQVFTNNKGERYPRSVIKIAHDKDSKFHPTQKPVALFEYLVRTYTNPGDLVLDNCSGSGTTAIAAEQSGRRWLCIERDPEYYAASLERIKNHIADTAEVSRQISLMDEIS